MTTGITVEGASLRFRLYHEKGADLKSRVTGLFSPAQERRPSYSEFWALHDVDLAIGHGERVGIIGHNGAGKSTLLKVISGIYQPTRGRVAVQGSVCSLLEIGTGFHPELSGRENLDLYGSIYGLSRAQIAAMAADVEAFTGLGEFMDTPVKYYSTGMYGRLAFASATAVKPEILILDEMFAGGDADFIGRATERMQAFIAAASIIVFVSHQLELIERFCQRTVWMDHGRVRADGATDGVLAGYRATVRMGEGGGMGGRGLEGGGGCGADLALARFENGAGGAVAEVAPGDRVVVRACFVLRQAVAAPIIGFMLKNQDGVAVLGENTWERYAGRAPAAAAGSSVEARFACSMPRLVAGRYSLTVALADGTQSNHATVLWADCVYTISVLGDPPGKGLIGIPCDDISLSVTCP
jgi:ABC-type polysaccharide/polyol phosphate transport system ATPase subunit